MKKQLLFFILFNFLFLFSFAQWDEIKYSQKNYLYFIYWTNNNKALKKENKIKRQSEFHKGSNVKNSTIDYVYSPNGNLIEHYKSKKEYYKITYHNDSLVRQVQYFNNGNIKWRDSITYSGIRIKNEYRFDEKNILIESKERAYDSTYITSFSHKKMKKGKMKETERYEYEYYPDYSYKKITSYRRGKLKHTNNFDCNPIGEVKKRDSQNCVKYETDSLGNKMRITLTTSKGYNVKIVEYIDTNNSVVYSKTYAMPSNNLIWEYYYNSKNHLLEKFVSYKDNKKEFFRMEYKYAPGVYNNYTEFTKYKKGKLIYTKKQEYDDKGMVIKSIEYNKANKIKSMKMYSYQYY